MNIADVALLALCVDFIIPIKQASTHESGYNADAENHALQHQLNDCINLSDLEFLARCHLINMTVARLLMSLTLTLSMNNRSQSPTPALLLIITLRFYGVGTFKVVTEQHFTAGLGSVSHS